MTMTLFGTLTSPYVRKVRIHARLMDVPVDLVNTAQEDGQARLRQLSPVWKVPVAVMDGLTYLDSALIVDALWARHAEAAVRNGLRARATGDARVDEDNLLVTVDGALDAAINRFYLLKDGVPDTGYVAKQRDRTLECLRAVERRLGGTTFDGAARPGITEVALLCALDWMVFRNQVDMSAFPGLGVFRARWGTEPWARDTYPVG